MKRGGAGDDRGLRPPSVLTFTLVALLVPLALALFAFWLVKENAEIDRARLAVRAAFDRRIAEGELISILKDGETGQRGYIITGDKGFLAPFLQSRAELPDRLRNLRSMTAGQPDQAARLRRLSDIIDRKFVEMEEVMRVRATAGPAAAAALVSSGTGKALMDEARATSSAMIAAENNTLARSRKISRARFDWMQRLVWTMVASIALVLAVALVWIWRTRRARYLLQLNSANAASRLETIFASTLDAIALLNPSGTIEMVNDAASRMLGFASSDLLRRDFAVLLDIAPGEGSFYERIGLVDGQLQQPRRADCIAHHKDGHTVPVDVSLGLMPLPDGIHFVASIRDVSDRKAIERMKDEFISTVSHELRTPLTSIVGSLGLLRADKGGMLPEGARRLVEIAENNSRRLIRLINDILDIEKMGAGQMRFETAPVMMNDLVRHAALGSEGLARAKGIMIDVGVPDDPVIVRGDSDRLLQVITNLMSNAIRFTPDGGTVQLLLEERNGKAVVIVDDQGPGVPPAFRGRVFARFAQAQAADGPTGGTGLGLAISHQIILAHDGTIWFEDRPEGGARFAFAIDILRVTPGIIQVDRPRVLICEDDSQTAETLRALVEADGYAAHKVASTDEAEAALRNGGFDALLLDMSLPDGSGLRLIRRLRASPDTRNLPIIAVSGSGADDDSGAAAALDMIDWLHTPIDQTRLGHAVQLAINRSAVAAPTLLHVDDDIDLLDVTAAMLNGQGRLLRATSLLAAREMLSVERPDIVILDVGLPDGSGAELLPMLRDRHGIAIPTIIYSAQEVSPEVSERVQAVLIKSRRSLPNLAGTIQRVLSQRSKGASR